MKKLLFTLLLGLLFIPCAKAETVVPSSPTMITRVSNVASYTYTVKTSDGVYRVFVSGNAMFVIKIR